MELTNQKGKKANTPRGGGKGEGASVVRQVAVGRIVVDQMTKKYNTRETSYQRQRVIGGHKGKEITAKKLDDEEEEELHDARWEHDEAYEES